MYLLFIIIVKHVMTRFQLVWRLLLLRFLINLTILTVVHYLLLNSLPTEFEASHGTVADLWAAHEAGKETSMNPLGMVEALLGAMSHSADLLLKSGTALPKSQAEAKFKAEKVQVFVTTLRKALHNTFRCAPLYH